MWMNIPFMRCVMGLIKYRRGLSRNAPNGCGMQLRDTNYKNRLLLLINYSERAIRSAREP
jgi:hypothetical protein